MAHRTRILFVIENSAYGGGEKGFSLLIRGLSKEKFEVFCAALPAGRFYEEVKDHCCFLPLDLTSRFSLGNIGRLRRMMAENKIELAHSQGARADFYCGLAAGGAGVKAVATVQMPVEGFDVCPLKKAAYLTLNSFSNKKFLRAITVSETLAALLRKKFPAVELIYNPVDLAEFSPANFNAAPVIEKYGLRGRLVLGAVGRLEWQKGYSCLISALALAVQKEPALKDRLLCLVAGSGSLEAKLKRQAEKAGLGGNLLFCGEVAEIRDFLGAVDVFLMPSLSEGQPLALLEAMAMAKPVIASDIPGISGTAEADREARLVPSGDPVRLAEAIIGLSRDAAAAVALGRNARKKAESFGLPAFIERHETVYSELAGV